MFEETETTELPRAALPAGGTTALLYDAVLVLVRKRTRRRVPFEAVERVDGPGPDGHTLRIELTSPHAGGEVITLRSDDAEALAAFDTALASSLPPRLPHQARRDGRRLTSVERIGLAPAREVQAAGRSLTLRILAALYVLALPVVFLASEDLGRSLASFDAVGDWLRAGVFLLPGLVLARLTASNAYTACLMRLRSATATGTLTDVHRGDDAGDPDQPVVYHYTFTDREGTDHHHESHGWPLSADGRTTPIRYDPRSPDRSYTPADRIGFPAQAAVGAIGLVLLGLGLYFAAPTALEAARVMQEDW
ncbi:MULTISPECIES: DUF3592 domain-containing protein [Streptomyces]|uniref:DUF3592 domain-containing protein n=1 Tax=Streptomyces TaxID=1883 RepID=UPI00163C2867|nr:MULTISPECIES: DUF3592 domain-containing protein [Streptomyces]MBC2878492.1 hypothetical protein [Streptomyces sp. TYQ1024]UBI38821.1 DUF3592 domain-containing protein [Streptomyces mobaraensis]UKW31401.1 DUF3592 domain-containing protein [Streptomyces sp. TYQ1024]